MSVAGRVQLGEIAEFINGVAFKPEDWVEEGHRIIRIQNLNDSTKPFNRTKREVDEKYHVHPGDLLVSWSASLGVFTWQNDDVALLNQHIFRVVPNQSRVDKSYLRHMLQDALDEMSKHLHGATMKHVNRKEFLSTTIPLPPLAEQKRIAGILDAADALRAKRRESIEQLRVFRYSLFEDEFGRPPKSTNCKLVPVGTIGEVQLGRQRAPKYQTGKYTRPYVRVANVFEDRIDTSDVLSMDFDQSDYEKYRLEPNDILLNEGQSTELVGRPAMWQSEIEDCCFQNTLVRFRPDPSFVVPEYALAVFLWYLRSGEFAKVSSKTSSVAHLGATRFAKMPFPLADLDCQKQFQESIQQARQMEKATESHLHDLNGLFASLQSRAFKGEL